MEIAQIISQTKHLTVSNNNTEIITGNKTTIITGNLDETIKGNNTLKYLEQILL